MLVNLGIVFLVCVAIAFIYIIKVIARDFDAPLKATKNYVQPKPKKVINSEPVKILPRPYSPSIARYVLSVVFLFVIAMITGVSGHNLLGKYIAAGTMILAGLSAVPLVFISAMPYRNKIEIGKIRFMACFITVLLIWLLMIFILNGDLYFPNVWTSLFVLYWLSIALSYYCCVHTYKSWFFLLIFWCGPLIFIPFCEAAIFMSTSHVVFFLPSSFIGMRVLIELYYWFKDKQIKSSENA